MNGAQDEKPLKREIGLPEIHEIVSMMIRNERRSRKRYAVREGERPGYSIYL